MSYDTVKQFSGAMKLSFLAIFGLTCLISAADGAVITVPGDQPTIQAAIVVSSSGDTVLVSPGTYNESIDFLAGGSRNSY